MVYLFALLQRTDVDLWDVMVSSEWSDADYVGAVRIMADALKSRLEPMDLAMLSRIVVLHSTEPTVSQFAGTDSASFEEMPQSDLGGVLVGRVFVFKVQRPPKTVLPETVTAVGTADV